MAAARAGPLQRAAIHVSVFFARAVAIFFELVGLAQFSALSVFAVRAVHDHVGGSHVGPLAKARRMSVEPFLVLLGSRSLVGQLSACFHVLARCSLLRSASKI